jgi:hypothetical protein
LMKATHSQEEEQSSSINNSDNNLENENLIGVSTEEEKVSSDIPSGVSIESASYIERNNLQENNSASLTSENNEEEQTPKLFSEEQDFHLEESSAETKEEEKKESDQLFDQDINEEEDFEIPAFLRKQKF